MELHNLEGVTHWVVPVNDLEESENSYGDLLGLNLLAPAPRGYVPRPPANPPCLDSEPGDLCAGMQRISGKADTHRRTRLSGKRHVDGTGALILRSSWEQTRTPGSHVAARDA